MTVGQVVLQEQVQVEPVPCVEKPVAVRSRVRVLAVAAPLLDVHNFPCRMSFGHDPAAGHLPAGVGVVRLLWAVEEVVVVVAAAAREELVVLVVAEARALACDRPHTCRNHAGA